MKSILITGANRGIGLGLVKKIASLANPPEHIFATCWNPSNAKVNKKLRTKKLNERVIIHFFGINTKGKIIIVSCLITGVTRFCEIS